MSVLSTYNLIYEPKVYTPAQGLLEWYTEVLTSLVRSSPTRGS